MIKALALSDILLDVVYSPWISSRFNEIDLLIGCGDLPYYYLEYILTTLNRPLFYVRGNHSYLIEYTTSGPKSHPQGGVDLHRRVVAHNGLILAGVEGSLRYRKGPYQYTQEEMWLHVLKLVPKLLWNRAVRGKYLDIFVTHAPPWGIHDQSDRPHQGIRAFRWLLNVFQPAYHFHGHIHIYRQDVERITQFRSTRVINAYGYIEMLIESVHEKYAPLGFLIQKVNP